MRCLLVLILWLLMPAWSFAASADLEPLRVGVGIGRPPFSYRTPSGGVTGFDVDIARAICQELKRPCLYAPWPLSRIRDGLETGQLDMIVGGMARTPAREKTMLFSEPYARMPSIFISHKNGPRNGMIEGMHVLAQTGSIQEDYLHSRASHFGSVSTVVTTQDLWDHLIKGEADAVLIDGLPGFAFLLSPEGADFELSGQPVSPFELPDTYHITLGLKNSVLRDEVNTALQAIRRKGIYTSINRKYFPFDVD